MYKRADSLAFDGEGRQGEDRGGITDRPNPPRTAGVITCRRDSATLRSLTRWLTAYSGAPTSRAGIKASGKTIEEWAEDHEMTFAQAIRRLVELGLKAKK